MTESAPVSEAAVKDEAAALADQLKDLADRHLRLQAEFDNFRKRKAREADEIRQYAAVTFIERMVTVLDHLYLALDPGHDRSDPKWGAGIDLIAKQILETLKSLGLEEISVRRGDKFEHGIHEAIAHTTDPDVGPGGVIEIVKKGYRFKDRVVRHAHVVVGSEVDSDSVNSTPSESAPE